MPDNAIAKQAPYAIVYGNPFERAARLAKSAIRPRYSVENLRREYIYADYLTAEDFVRLMDEAYFLEDGRIV